MSIGSKVEAALRGIVERPFAWLIRTGVNRNEFWPQVERAMEEYVRKRDDPGDGFSREAPTRYDIFLSAKDYGVFGADQRLAHRLRDQVIQVAKERRYWLEREPNIHFYEDSRIITGQMRVEPHFFEEVGDSSGGSIDETRSMSPVEMQQLNEDIAREQAAVALPPAWLTLFRPTRGQPMPLQRPIIHIGRHTSNEIIVNDPRVSRHHAEIRYERGQFVLYDLSSTNGVKINGAPARQAVPLRNNDLITVGDQVFVFQRR